MSMNEAMFYEKSDAGVRCLLCPHNCVIGEGNRGVCNTRVNIEGRLFSTNYGEITAMAMDPVEKKPLYHFYPGSAIFSVGSRGCNLKCPFCQNWQISQNSEYPATFYTPKDLVNRALKYDTIGIAYTYNEPSVWFEYVMDVSEIVCSKGLKNVLVSNGTLNEKPFDLLCGVIDAMNIDLKSFNGDVYRKIIKGDLETVKRNIATAHSKGVLVEVTTLVVTGINDNFEELINISDFLASIDRSIPWHISRYHPSYKYDKDPTDIDFMIDVYEAASESLDYVYTGNIAPSLPGGDTVCPGCGTILVSRSGYNVVVKALDGQGKCSGCGHDTGIRM